MFQNSKINAFQNDSITRTGVFMRGKINDLNGMQFFDTHDKVTLDTFLIRKLSMNNVHYFPNASYNHKQNVNGYLRKHSSLQTNLDSQLLFLFMSKGYHIKKLYVRIWYGIKKVYLICTTESRRTTRWGKRA